jgi:hypothetical protein
MTRHFFISVCVALVLTGGLAGCRNRTADATPAVVPRFLIESDAGRGAIGVTLPVSGVHVRVAPKPVITEYDITSVAEARVDLGNCLLFQLTPAASRDLYRLSAENIGRRLVLLINGRPLGARVIDRPLEAGMLLIFVEVPDASLPALVDDLNHTAGVMQREAAQHG